jgi:hypothetical protein
MHNAQNIQHTMQCSINSSSSLLYLCLGLNFNLPTEGEDEKEINGIGQYDNTLTPTSTYLNYVRTFLLSCASRISDFDKKFT